MEYEGPSWASAWTSVSDDNLKGWVPTLENADKVRRLYESAKSIVFIGDKKTAHFGHLQVIPPDPSSWSRSAISSSGVVEIETITESEWMVRPQLDWQAELEAAEPEGQKLSSYVVRFGELSDSMFVNDGTPFMVIGTYKMNCMYGRNKHKCAQSRERALREADLQSNHPVTMKRRRKSQESKKKGCRAIITMKEVIRFPQFQLESQKATSKSAQAVKSRELKDAIRSSSSMYLQTEHRIYISLPRDEDHKDTHPVGRLTAVSLTTLHKDLGDKLQQLVCHGVTNVKQMRRHLKIHVETILFPDPKSRPAPSNVAYYPSDRCLRNNIYLARMKLRQHGVINMEMCGISTMSELTEVSSNKSFNGLQKVFSHESSECKCKMTFSVYLPSQAENGPCPTLVYLSGLTCTDQNVTTKGGFQRVAAQYGMVVVCPDTSPRGCQIEGEDDSYDFGSGAGFYVDATEEKWKTNYRMYSYVTKELFNLMVKHFPVNPEKVGIFGHSMGGHGALMIGLRNPDLFKSVSAFAPICNPINCPWGQKAFNGYLGPDENTWKEYDACELVRSYDGPPREILIDQGKADNFYGQKQLLPENFVTACQASHTACIMNLREGYDHSYYFISTFMEDHIKFHSQHL